MRRTKAEAEETRQRILIAAEHVFFDMGVAETTLEQVAREAGVTRGAIYWHFANKTELLLALHDTVPLPQEDMLQREMESSADDPLRAIEKAAGDWLQEISTDQHRQRIHTILLRCDYSREMADILEKQRDIDADKCNWLHGAFQTIHAKRQLHPGWTPYGASRCVTWFMKGLYIDWLRFGMQFDIVAEGKLCLSQLFESFRVKPGST